MNDNHFLYDEFIKAGEVFLHELVTDLKYLGLPIESLESDHLCFRVSTIEEYDGYKTHLSNAGRLLTESHVNGRPISTFVLDKGFNTTHHHVKLVELPAPKAGVAYETGFEHAEFILKESFEGFVSKFPLIEFKPIERKTLNPELCLKLNGKQAKFHHHSLERIIEIEKSLIKHIVFDFDGTLIQSRENIYEINRRVFSKILEREVLLEEVIDKFHSEFSKLFSAFSVDSSEKQAEALINWTNVSEQLTYNLFDEVDELLHELIQRGFQLHLWTARDERSARKILSDLKIDHYFTTMSFSNSTVSKPQVQSLNFDWESASPNQILVIGDSPADILGSKNIRALGGAALWDAHTNISTLEATGADLFFFQLSDLKNWLYKKAPASDFQ